jgi:hypothetical protein
MVTSISNTAISHSGKRGLTMTGVAALAGVALDFIGDMRMRLPQNYQQAGNVGTPFLLLENVMASRKT